MKTLILAAASIFFILDTFAGFFIWLNYPESKAWGLLICNGFFMLFVFAFTDKLLRENAEIYQPKHKLEATLRAVEEKERIEAAIMPTENDALRVMFSAYQRLKKLGFRDACYCPKGGEIFEAIEAGSTGIHKCSYSGQWPKGTFWIHDDEHHDLFPSRPILFRMQKK